MCWRRTSTFSPSRASCGAAILRPSFSSRLRTSGAVTAWRARPANFASMYQLFPSTLSSEGDDE